MATRPVEVSEYKRVIELCISGFEYQEEDKLKRFKTNKQLALILQLQASLGLRIGDVLKLRVNSFKGDKLETIEEKTGKLQYRTINAAIVNIIMNYAIENNLKKDDLIFNVKVRAVQKQLKIVCDYLNLENISTHSFRKLFACTAYQNNDKDIYLVKELLNHSSIATTQRYIKVSQEAINRASADMNFMI